MSTGIDMNERIRVALGGALAPLHLDLEDESHKHNVPPGAQSHWKLVIVSEAFEGQRLVGRQRLVYGALQAEMAGGIHALSMKTLTPAEWAAQGGVVTHRTPPCLGGSKAEG